MRNKNFLKKTRIAWSYSKQNQNRISKTIQKIYDLLQRKNEMIANFTLLKDFFAMVAPVAAHFSGDFGVK